MDGIFWNFLVIGDYNIQIVAAKFSALIFLPCYNQVAKTVTFNSDFSVYYKIAFVNPKRKNYLRLLWNPSYKKQFCAAQKDRFSWNHVLYAVPHFFNVIPG